jgi:hypothetical protein
MCSISNPINDFTVDTSSSPSPGSVLVYSIWRGGGVLAMTGWNFPVFRDDLS